MHKESRVSVFYFLLVFLLLLLTLFCCVAIFRECLLVYRPEIFWMMCNIKLFLEKLENILNGKSFVFYFFATALKIYF